MNKEKATKNISQGIRPDYHLGVIEGIDSAELMLSIMSNKNEHVCMFLLDKIKNCQQLNTEYAKGVAVGTGIILEKEEMDVTHTIHSKKIMGEEEI